MYVFMDVFMYACLSVCMLHVCMDVFVYVCLSVCMFSSLFQVCIGRITCADICIRMYIYTRVQIYIFACIYTHMYRYIYVGRYIRNTQVSQIWVGRH